MDESTVGVGSIAGGGRYDELVGMFSSGKEKIPCVGISFGVERIFSLLAAKESQAGVKGRGKETEVYVMSVGDGLVEERMKVCKELWDAGIKVRNPCHQAGRPADEESQAEFMYKVKPKTARQFEAVEKDATPFIVILGPDEVKAGEVKVKQQLVVGRSQADAGKADDGSDKDGVGMKRQEMVPWLKARLGPK